MMKTNSPLPQTLYENFQMGVKRSPHGKCIGARSGTAYKWLTYTQTNVRLQHFAAGLSSLNCMSKSAQNLQFLAHFMPNRLESVLTFQAVYSLGGTIVTLYVSLGDHRIVHILNQTQITTIVCGQHQVDKLLQLKSQVPTLEKIIVCGGEKQLVPHIVTTTKQQQQQYDGVMLYSFEQVEQIGAKQYMQVPTEYHTKPDDIALLIYTSGTSGMPKGSLLTHAGLVASSQGIKVAICPELYASPDNLIHLSYNPMAHIFENLMQNFVFYHGGAVGIYQGDPQDLLDDLVVLRPTIFISVPRVLHRIYRKIQTKETNSVLQWAFNWAVQSKLNNLLHSNTVIHPLWDPLLFRPLTKRIGLDRCREIVTGGGPNWPGVVNFFRIMTGRPVIEGYGSTECSGAVCMSKLDDYSTNGHVGNPMKTYDFKLVSLPGMGYNNTDTSHEGQKLIQGRGEICLRGPQIFSGYYRLPELTKEVIKPDGWYHTGDIGLVTEDGNIQIIDRKQHMFKLEGYNISPERIENILMQSHYIDHAFVYGDNFCPYLVAVIIPSPSSLLAFASDKMSLNPGLINNLCRNSKIKELIRKECHRISQFHQFSPREYVKQIHLCPTPFTVANGLLTPTFKLKRTHAKEWFAKEIESMYTQFDKH